MNKSLTLFSASILILCSGCENLPVDKSSTIEIKNQSNQVIVEPQKNLSKESEGKVSNIKEDNSTQLITENDDTKKIQVDEALKNKNTPQSSELNTSGEKANLCKVLGIEKAYPYEGGCENGLAETKLGEKSSIKYNDGEYQGEFKRGYFEGSGILKFNNGDIYEGIFKLGKMNGAGTYLWKNGNRYSGEFVDGKKEDAEALFYDATLGNKLFVNYKNDKPVIDSKQVEEEQKREQDIKSIKSWVKENYVEGDESARTINFFRISLKKGIMTNQGEVIQIDRTNHRVLIQKDKYVTSASGDVIPIPTKEWIDINDTYPP